MLSVTSPLWLLVLLSLPLLFWLHLFRERGGAVPVVALFLWTRDLDSGNGGQRASRPDPIWLLRALFICLLTLALSGPRWLAPRQAALTVWLDDSTSMFTVEGGETRMGQALVKLESALASGEFEEVVVRSLGAPGEMLLLKDTGWRLQLRDFSARPRGEPNLPAPQLMAPDQLHWLVSDGASPGVVEWASRAPLEARFQVGVTRNNVGITSIALRRNGGGGAAASISITVRNGGEQEASRVLGLYAGAESLGSWSLLVPGSGGLARVLALDRVPSLSLRAQLEPEDALPLDDHLLLPAANLRPFVVRLAGKCGSHLQAALQSRADLEIARSPGVDTDLQVHCGSYQQDPDVPTLILPGSGPEAAVQLQEEPLWQAAAGGLRELTLRPDWLSVLATGATAAEGGAALLRAGERSLIVHDPEHQVIVVDLDFNAPPFVRRPEYPLLVSALVDRLLGSDLSREGITRVDAEADVTIAPGLLPAARAGNAREKSTDVRDLSAPVLVAALILLALDLLLSLRRQRSPVIRGARLREVE